MWLVHCPKHNTSFFADPSVQHPPCWNSKYINTHLSTHWCAGLERHIDDVLSDIFRSSRKWLTDWEIMCLQGQMHNVPVMYKQNCKIQGEPGLSNTGRSPVPCPLPVSPGIGSSASLHRKAVMDGWWETPWSQWFEERCNPFRPGPLCWPCRCLTCCSGSSTKMKKFWKHRNTLLLWHRRSQV